MRSLGVLAKKLPFSDIFEFMLSSREMWSQSSSEIPFQIQFL